MTNRSDKADVALGALFDISLPGQARLEALRADVAASIQRERERLNSEFNNYAPADRRRPHVRLLPHAEPHYFPLGVKHRYTR